MPSECGKYTRPSIAMFVPLPTPQAALAEIAEAVDRDDDRLLERRNMKGRGKMRQMMLDLMHLAAKALAGKVRCQQIRDALARAPVLEPVEHEPEVRALRHQIGELPEEIGPAVLIDGDVLDIGEREARFPQAIGDRLRRESQPNA